MKNLFEILQWIPLVIIGFIVLALAMRIIAKILFRTFFEIQKEEKEKEKDDPQNK